MKPKSIGRPKAALVLTDDERAELRRYAQRHTGSQHLAQRSRIVLRCATGATNGEVAEALDVREATVSKWRGRFVRLRLDGLRDARRPGAPRRVTDDRVEELVRATLELTPKNATHWSTRSMAKHLGLNQTMVSRIWRAFGLKPHRAETFSISNDPLFVDKVRDIVGLYLNPPDNALVIQIDGKGVPTVTATELERRRGPRKKNRLRGSARHRGRARRGTWNRKQRHPGEAKDPRKNAKVAMVLVMYTLRRGKDGLLHGPLNKRVWATFASKREIFAIARREAKKRGFDPSSDRKLIEIVTDGDDDFARNASAFFPHAVQTIDIMHVLEYVWHAGRCLHPNEHQLREWAGTQKHRLLHGGLDKVVDELDQALERRTLSKAKRKIIERSRDYIFTRSDKLDYAWLRDQDLEIGTGAVEGAVNHIVALRFDHGGMRWIRERANALLGLRCIAFNGDWDAFIDYVHEKLLASARRGTVMPLLRNSPKLLPNPAKAA